MNLLADHYEKYASVLFSEEEAVCALCNRKDLCVAYDDEFGDFLCDMCWSQWITKKENDNGEKDSKITKW